MLDLYQPKSEPKFTFGLWTVGNNRRKLGARGLPYERLDQLTVEVLLGVR